MQRLLSLLILSLAIHSLAAQIMAPDTYMLQDSTSYPYFRNRVRGETRMIAVDSRNAQHYMARAYYRMQMQDYLASIDDNTIAIRLDSTNVDAYSNRGMAKCFLNRSAEAIPDL